MDVDDERSARLEGLEDDDDDAYGDLSFTRSVKRARLTLKEGDDELARCECSYHKLQELLREATKRAQSIQAKAELLLAESKNLMQESVAIHAESNALQQDLDKLHTRAKLIRSSRCCDLPSYIG